MDDGFGFGFGSGIRGSRKSVEVRGFLGFSDPTRECRYLK